MSRMVDVGRCMVGLLAVTASVTGGCAWEASHPADKESWTDPASPGPWPVATVVLPGKGLTLHVPSSSNAFVDQTLFPWPAVVLVPGFSGTERMYQRTSRYLASHGFVVAAINRNLDIPQAMVCRTQVDVMDQVVKKGVATLRQQSSKDGLFPGLITEGRMGVTGHSLGGKMALWLALEDDHVGAVFALDPVDNGSREDLAWCADRFEHGFPSLLPRLPELRVPVAMVGAGMAGECAPASGNWEALSTALGAHVERTVYLLPRAGHTDFADSAEDKVCLNCGVCPHGEEKGEDVLRFTRTMLTAFFKVHVARDDRYRNWTGVALPGAVVPREGFVEIRAWPQQDGSVGGW